MIFTQILIRIKRANVTFFQSAVALALLAVFLPACTNLADEQPTAETGAAEVTLNVERFATPEAAEMDHFVAAVDDDLFIGVAVAEPGASEEDPRTVAVYLCDGQTVSQWLIEEVTGQEATLVAGDASVDVTIADNGVSGTVALGGGEPQPFTAELATGDAGVYRAEWYLGGVDYRVDWVVLNDGRQRGPIDGKGNDVLINFN